MEDVGVDVSQDEDETGEQRYESRGEVNSVTRYNSSQGLRIFFSLLQQTRKVRVPRKGDRRSESGVW